jgi:hypothetical protein
MRLAEALLLASCVLALALTPTLAVSRRSLQANAAAATETIEGVW